MRRTDKLRELNSKLIADNRETIKHLDKLGDECFRIGEHFGRAGEIMADLDAEFSKATGITYSKDLTFLFVAIGLLCAKWLIMGKIAPLDFDFKHEPSNESRIADKEGKSIEDKKSKEELDKIKKTIEKDKDIYTDEGYRTVFQILTRPVPYDAFAPKEFPIPGHLQQLSGLNHHAYTLGHDPILGYLFGPINIMTRTLTYKSPGLETFTVTEKGNRIYGRSSIGEAFFVAWKAFKADIKRLPAAVAREGIHLYSDKTGKTGLPIPFLSAEKAQELIEKGWNSDEAEKAIKKVTGALGKDFAIVGIQFAVSLLINEIIKAIHMLMYDEEKDGDIRLYQVRTRKILLTANCISSASNILVATGIAIAAKNPAEAAKRFDIGGFIATIHRLVSDTKFIREIKQEYLKERFAEKVLSTDFNWLYSTN
ncbi:MAG: hypothetical protein LBK56_04670 [Gracilibacteraceae bacterium]|jgi:hypothetical protein|nr:hypothetical protein [Gracilibacteraceae bacterium]